MIGRSTRGQRPEPYVFLVCKSGVQETFFIPPTGSYANGKLFAGTHPMLVSLTAVAQCIPADTPRHGEIQ